MKQSGIVFFVAVWLATSSAKCDEPCEPFLQALRDRGYFDVALDYMQEMETSPMASVEFRQTLPFERATTLIRSTSQIKDFELMEERLDEAQQLLTESESSATSPELIARSQDYQGDLSFRRAKIYLNLADNDRLTANEKAEHFVKARGFLTQALDTFGRAKESYKEILDNFQLDLRNPGSKRQLKRLRGLYTVVRVKLPQILELSADTLANDDPDRKANLEAAATEFEQLWLKYPNFPAGLDSCLYAARCQFKLKKYPESLSFLQQIFNLPDNAALLTLQRRAMVMAADCWSEMSPYPFDDVIANFEPYSSRLTRREQRVGDWQRIQLELARAYHAKAVELKKASPGDGRIKTFDRDAGKIIKSVARLPGDQRSLARKLMAQWNLNVDSDPPEDIAPILTFDDAKQKGIDLITEIEGVHADISDFRRRLKAENAVEQEQLQTDLETAELQLATLTKNCLGVFERALALADSNVSREELNQIRYLQGVCYYTQKNYFESGLIGEFLVDRYPTIAYSRQAGGIGVRSYAILHDRAGPADREFERERLSRLAEKVVNQWPGSTESTEAATSLTKLILSRKEFSDKEIARATELIGSVPGTSTGKAVLNIKLGTKLWFAYLKKKVERSETSEELDTRLAQAVEYLADGVKGFNSGNLRMEAAWGSLFLVDAHLESGNLDAAIQQLESASVAPIDLIKQKNATVFGSDNASLFVGETYKIAGKTYLAAMGKFPEDNAWTDRATGIVRAMRSRAQRNGDAKAKQDVTNMYRLIAVALKKQLESIDDFGEQEQFLARLSQFLETIQSESNDPNTIIWAGKTLMSIAESFVDRSMADEAKPLFGSAISALDRASQMGVDDEKLLDELKRLRAIAKRGAGKFEDSYNDLLELLKRNPDAWRVQMDVAKTLQMWGIQTKTLKPLAKALSGTERFKDPKTRRTKNLIWGWTKLAQALKSNSKLADAYYRSLTGAVETRFEYGVIEKNPKIIAASLKRLKIAKAKDQQLGGPSWKPKFDKLEKRIQQQLNSMQVSGASK